MEPSELLIPENLNFLVPAIVGDLVRTGCRHDGGYVVPRSAVDASDVLLSLGIGDNWSFDRDFRRRNPTVPIHAYDDSISGEYYLNTALDALKGVLVAKYPFVRRSAVKFSLHRLKCFFGYQLFFRKEVKHYLEKISDTRRVPSDVTIDTVFERANPLNAFLKVDIEGTEYRIIADILKYADRINCMVIEFHDTHKCREEFTNAVMDLLGSFDIVHFHANNYAIAAPDNLPEILELTFLKKTRIEFAERRTTLPLPGLDSPCRIGTPDYIIRF